MNVLVTGGSRGIGAAIVKKFAENGHKTVFVYNSNREAAEAVAESCGAFPLKADLSSPTEAEEVYKKAQAQLGEINVLVNCAGIALVAQICDTGNSALERILNTDLASVYVLCREASRDMVKEKKGAIVNIGSVWGRVGASCESAYSAAKAGIRGLTMALAKELAPSRVRVNCVEPGFIATDMNAGFNREDLEAICSDIPLGRAGDAEEVAELVYFLCSENARYITGQCIGIDGGFGL